jgi:hypothetical protein
MPSRRVSLLLLFCAALLLGSTRAPGAEDNALTADELNQLWDTLIVDADGMKPFQAICTLVRHPDQAVQAVRLWDLAARDQ